MGNRGVYVTLGRGCCLAASRQEEGQEEAAQEQELSQEDLNAKMCTKFVKGQYRKAAQALTSAGLAQDCPATV